MATNTEVQTIPAEELSPEEVQAAAEAAFTLNERVKEGIRAGQQALWVVASALYEFEETSGWLALGFEKKGDWLADPEISMTRRTYNRLVHAWRTLVVQRELPPAQLEGLDVSKIDIVLPRLEKGEVTMESALEDVKTLGARDLREAYMRPKLGRPKGPEVVEAGPGSGITEPSVAAPDVDAELAGAEPGGEPAGPENAVDEAALMRMFDARAAAKAAMDGWTINRTEGSGNAMYEALRTFMELTE